MTSRRDLLAMLLPAVAYDTAQVSLNAELTAEGNVFDKTDTTAGNVLGGVTPIFSGDLLTDWERVLGLTPDSDDSWQKRLESVLIKLSETGGLSREYFISLAWSIGYTITIDELDPFRAGQGRAGDYLYEEDIIWVWQINIIGSEIPSYLFRAGESYAGESLEEYGDSVIETWFNDLKPAHTLCIFTYRRRSTGPFFDGSWVYDGTLDYTVGYQ